MYRICICIWYVCVSQMLSVSSTGICLVCPSITDDSSCLHGAAAGMEKTFEDVSHEGDAGMRSGQKTIEWRVDSRRPLDEGVDSRRPLDEGDEEEEEEEQEEEEQEQEQEQDDYPGSQDESEVEEEKYWEGARGDASASASDLSGHLGQVCDAHCITAVAVAYMCIMHHGQGSVRYLLSWEDVYIDVYMHIHT
jgi:hypothetical protein